MNLNVCILLVSATLVLTCDAYQIGKGKFESYNGNRYTEAKSMDDNNTKAFLNLNRNRPPAHDTPASPCSCSKFIRNCFASKNKLPNANSNQKVSNIFGHEYNLCKSTLLFLSPTRSRAQLTKKLFVALIAKVFRSLFKSSTEFYGNCDSKNSNERQNRKNETSIPSRLNLFWAKK